MGGVKILESSHVAAHPPPPPSTIPLSFLDIVPSMFAPVQLLFFYQLSCTTPTFLSSHLPALKHSLSLALRHFYPLAGHMIVPHDGSLPFLRYSPSDSVPFATAESDDVMDELTLNHPKPASSFHPLVPTLPFSPFSGEPQRLLSVQATIFPGRGVAIGVCVHHAMVDVFVFGHLMRTWASFFRLGEDAIVDPPVILDRSVLPDPRGLRDLFWRRIKEIRSHVEGRSLNVQPGSVRATFPMTLAQLEAVRGRLLARTGRRFSSFTLASALTWVCLTRANKHGGHGNVVFRFLYSFRGRGRMDPPVPVGYLGNCFVGRSVVATRRELEGVEEACELIRREIEAAEADGLGNVDEYVSGFASIMAGASLRVGSSPNVGLYKVNFGWGCARKVEVVSIDMVSVERTVLMSLNENADEEAGGIEIGLVLPPTLMDEFVLLFHSTLEALVA